MHLEMSPDPRQIMASLFAASARTAPCDASAFLEALASAARAQQLAVLNLGLQSPGEARELCNVLAGIAMQALRHGRPALPTLILSAGEAQVGGRPAGAAQFLIALALALDAHPAIHAFAAEWPDEAGDQIKRANSGTDGAAPAWAALATPDMIERARALGLLPERLLAGSDAAQLFERTGTLMTIDGQASGAGVLRAVLLL